MVSCYNHYCMKFVVSWCPRRCVYNVENRTISLIFKFEIFGSLSQAIHRSNIVGDTAIGKFVCVCVSCWGIDDELNCNKIFLSYLVK